MSDPLFKRVALIGLGLIGSSLARAMKKHGLAGHVAGTARSAATRAKAFELGYLDSVHDDAAACVKGADLVVICAPLGAYAEPAPEAEQASDGPVFERCLKFALDGWSVVQLMERRAPAEHARWTRDAAVQLVSAGLSGDIPVLVLVDATCGGPLKIETRLHSAQAIIDEHGLPGGLMMVLGPIVPGPAPQVYAFAANGLAG